MSFDGGWFKIYRRIFDSDGMQDDWLFRLFVWCISEAQFQETCRSNNLERGQFMTSRNLASEKLKVSPSKWYRGIERLSVLGKVSVKANSGRSIVTVCNYSSYQAFFPEKDQKRTSGDTGGDTASEQPSLDKEWKNGRIGGAPPKKDTGGAPPDSGGAPPAMSGAPLGLEGAPSEKPGGAPPVDDRLATDNLAFLWRSHVRVRKPESQEIVVAGIDEMVDAGIPRQAIFDEVVRGPRTTPKRDRSEWLKQMQDRLLKRLGMASSTNPDKPEPFAGLKSFVEKGAEGDAR